MKNKAIIILIIIVAGFLAALYLMGYFPFGDEPDELNNDDISIKSEDELAELMIPRDALPDNVDLDDISVTMASNRQTENGTWVVYELEPDGLEFTEEVLFNVTLESFNDSIPLVFVSTSTGVDLINNTFVEVDLENHTQIVTIPLTHFSTVSIGPDTGAISLKLSAPDEVIVGDTVNTVASFTFVGNKLVLDRTDDGDRIYVYEFRESHVTYKGTWLNKGNINNFTPDGTFGGKPSSTKVGLGQTKTVEDNTFKCDVPGGGYLWYKAEVTVNLKLTAYNSESDFVDGKFNSSINLRNQKIEIENKVRLLCHAPKLIIKGIYVTKYENRPEIDLILNILGPSNASGFVTLTGRNMEPMIQPLNLGDNGGTQVRFTHAFSGEITIFAEVGELNATRKHIID